MGNVKLKGSLDRKDHKMEFEILRAARKVHRKLTTLDFRRGDFGLSKICPIEYHGIKEGRGIQESWLVFKDHLLQAQE